MYKDQRFLVNILNIYIELYDFILYYYYKMIYNKGWNQGNNNYYTLRNFKIVYCILQHKISQSIFFCLHPSEASGVHTNNISLILFFILYLWKKYYTRYSKIIKYLYMSLYTNKCKLYLSTL